VNLKHYQEEENVTIVTVTIVTAVAVTVLKGPVLVTVARHLAEVVLYLLI
jgi:hypothetical protein